jgi:type IV secretory pathway TrbL component
MSQRHRPRAMKLSAGVIVFLSLLMAVATILGIVGALRYSIYMVGLAFFPFSSSLSRILVLALMICVYPHVAFIKEVHEGITTKERDTHVQQSRCCI